MDKTTKGRHGLEKIVHASRKFIVIRNIALKNSNVYSHLLQTFNKSSSLRLRGTRT